jgi:hypothetical protein
MGDPPRSKGGTAVKSNVPVAEAISDEAVLPERVQEALGQLVGTAREGLLALSVEVGLGVLRELLEAEVEEIVGPKGKWNPDRVAVRHGHEDGEVTLGGRRVSVSRPRVRTADGESEVPLTTYEDFADRDQLGDVVLERMLAGVSTRHYRRTQEPVGREVEADARSTSKSAVSRTFVSPTRDQLWKLMNRPLADLRLAVMMLDGIDLYGRANIVALGVTTDGEKLALGLWEGSTRTRPSAQRCWPTWLTPECSSGASGIRRGCHAIALEPVLWMQSGFLGPRSWLSRIPARVGVRQLNLDRYLQPLGYATLTSSLRLGYRRFRGLRVVLCFGAWCTRGWHCCGDNCETTTSC